MITVFERQPSSLDRITQWRVLMNVGRPIDHKVLVIPWRTVGLTILLILVALWGLGAAGAERGALQKGRGGLGQIQIPALEKSENFRDLSDPTVYNFLQIPPGPVRDAVAEPAPAPRPLTPIPPTKSMKLMLALTIALLLMMWIDLRLTRYDRRSLR